MAGSTNIEPKYAEPVFSPQGAPFGVITGWDDMADEVTITAHTGDTAVVSLHSLIPVGGGQWQLDAGVDLDLPALTTEYGDDVEVNPLEVQEGGSHYKTLAIQPMEYSMANKLDACQHTIIKYVTRFRDKGGVEDLRKARHTIDMLIHFEEGGI